MKIKVGLVLVSDKKMKQLNKKYLNKSETTDVLSFEMKEKMDDVYYLGDIVVSLPQLKRQAKNFNVTEKEELVRLITHGALHLLGEEDSTKKGFKKMKRIEDKTISTIFKKNEKASKKTS